MRSRSRSGRASRDAVCRCRRSTGGRRWCRPAAWSSKTRTAARPACGSSTMDRLVLLLPGPPRELKPMLTRLVEGPLAARAAGLSLVRRSIRLTGRTESHTEEAVRPLYPQWASAPHPDSRDDSGLARTDRAAPLGARDPSRRSGGGARGGSAAGRRGAGPGRLQHRWPVAGAGRRRTAGGSRAANRGRRVVHRRTHHVAAD